MYMTYQFHRKWVPEFRLKYNNLLFRVFIKLLLLFYNVHFRISVTTASVMNGMCGVVVVALKNFRLRMFCDKIIERTIADVRRIKEHFIYSILIYTAQNSHKT